MKEAFSIAGTLAEFLFF